MNTDPDGYLKWLEAQNWAELEPNTLVVYRGTILTAQGKTYRVVNQVDDDRYTIADPNNEWSRLNANRRDLTPIEQEN